MAVGYCPLEVVLVFQPPAAVRRDDEVQDEIHGVKTDRVKTDRVKTGSGPPERLLKVDVPPEELACGAELDVDAVPGPGSISRIRLPPAQTRSVDTQLDKSRTLVPAEVRAPRNAVSGARYSTVRPGESATTRIGIAVITAPRRSFRQSTGSPGLSVGGIGAGVVASATG